MNTQITKRSFTKGGRDGVVAAVSAAGESRETWDLARAVHEGEAK